MDILKKIAATKRREVEAKKRSVGEPVIKELAEACCRPVLSVSASILSRAEEGGGIIAEHKRRSPSKGEIFPMSEVGDIAEAYAGNGAAAMSVLTDTPYFGGSLADLAVARAAAPGLPILRKEFIVDPWQIYEARVYGADAVLLIAAMIEADEIALLNDTAHSLGLQTLVEVHSEEELAAVPADADMVGVNNRDLSTFSTDISNSMRLIEKLPSGIVRIAESGIKTPGDVAGLRKAGFSGFLIGESFMSAPEPGAALSRFVREIAERGS